MIKSTFKPYPSRSLQRLLAIQKGARYVQRLGEGGGGSRKRRAEGGSWMMDTNGGARDQGAEDEEQAVTHAMR